MNINPVVIPLLVAFSAPTFAFQDEFEKAIAAFETEQIEAAYIHVKNVLKAEPGRLPAKLLYADILIEKGMLLEAEDELLSARALGADINLLVEPLGQVLVRLGQYQRVFTEFEGARLSLQASRSYTLLQASAYLGLKEEQRALALYQDLNVKFPNDEEVQLGLASVYIALFELEQAHQIVAKLLNEDKNNPAALRYLGTLHYLVGEYLGASEVFNQALSLEPENSLSLRGLVNAHIALDDFKQAQTYVDQLIALEPYDPQARLLNSIVLSGLNQNEQANRLLKQINDELSSLDQTFILSKPQLMLIDAMASYNLANWEQSRVKFNRYVSNAGKHIDVRAVVLLADVYQKLGKPSDALQILETHSERLLQNKDFALLLVSLYVRYNQKIDAEQLLRRLQSLYQNDQDILIYSAHILSQKQQIDKALNLLATAEQKDSPHYRHTLAVLYLKAGQSDKAISLMTDLVAEQPENMTYQLMLVESLKLAGKMPAAFKLISELAQRNPDNNNVKSEYAKFLFVRGERQKAYELFLDLYLLDEDNREYALNLAEIEYATGRFESAISRLQAVAQEPVYERQALLKLASLYSQIERFQNSLEVANRLLRIDRLNDRATFLKAQALINLNQATSAKSQINRLVTLWQNDSDALIKLAKLQVQIEDTEGANRSFEQALSIAPMNANIVIEKVKFELFTGQLKAADESLNKLQSMERVPQHVLTTLKGDRALAGKNNRLAFDFYADALRHSVAHVPAFMKLSSVGKSRALSCAYIKVAEAVIEKSNNPLYRNTLAEHLMLYKEYERAKFHYQTLLTQSIPKQTAGFAFNNLAMIGVYQQQYSSAVKYAEQALALISDIPAIFDTAGWASSLNGDFDKGLYYLRQAYAMNAQSTEILYHLAYTLVKMGKQQEAETYFRQLEQFGDYPEKAKVEQLR